MTAGPTLPKAKHQLMSVDSNGFRQPSVPPLIKEYVKLGLGITIISGLSLSAKHAQPMHMIPVTKYFGKLGYGVVIRKGKFLTLAAREFLKILGVEVK